jgi:hypothetical protein
LARTVVAIVGVRAFDAATVRLGSFFPDQKLNLAALTLVSEAQAQAALGNPASPIALAARRVADDYAHNRAVRDALATPARCFVLPPDGVLIGGNRSSPFGLDVLNAGGLALKVVTPNTDLSKTVVAIVGVPAFDRVTATLRSFFPDQKLNLAALTLVSEDQAQAALGAPASPIALAARRVADDYAHNRAVRDAAEAAKQCALLARIAAEAGGDPADERFLCATCKQPFRLQGLFRHQAVCVACANCGEVCTRATLPGHLRKCLDAGTSNDPLSVPAPCRTCAAALAPLRAAHAVACLFARSEYSACSRICARRLPT